NGVDEELIMRKRNRFKLALAAGAVATLVAGSASAGRITLYRGVDFTGSTLATNDAVSNMERSQFRDVAASAVVTHGTWEACTEAYFQGRCAELRPGNYSQLSRQLDAPVGSVREVGVAPSAPVRVSIAPDAPPVVATSRWPVVSPATAPKIVLYRHAPQGVVT